MKNVNFKGACAMLVGMSPAGMDPMMTGSGARHRMRPCRPGRELQAVFAADEDRMPLTGLAVAVVSSIGLWSALAAVVL